MAAALDVDIAQLESVRRLLQGAERSIKPTLLQKIGAELETTARDRIDSGDRLAPDGTDWPEWSESYLKTRRGQHSLLLGEGNLMDSIQSSVDGRGFVEVGSNLIYAATHQFGDDARNIPARPFLGISSNDEGLVLEIIESVVKSHTGGA